jgi:hypothetical protein
LIFIFISRCHFATPRHYSIICRLRLFSFTFSLAYFDAACFRHFRRIVSCRRRFIFTFHFRRRRHYFVFRRHAATRSMLFAIIYHFLMPMPLADDHLLSMIFHYAIIAMLTMPICRFSSPILPFR